MHQFISDTAKYGDLSAVRGWSMRRQERDAQDPQEIQSGKFAAVDRGEQVGQKEYRRMLKQDMDRQIERVGVTLRAKMPWLNDRRA